MLKKDPKCLLIGRPCPKNGDPDKGDYCPRWWRESWINEKSNREVREGCGDVMLPEYLSSLHHVMEHAGMEASSLKNDARGIIEKKLDEALSAMPAFVRQCVQRIWIPQALSYTETKVIDINEGSRPKV